MIENITGDEDYVPRQVALEALRIKPQTLYAYVSRGLIRSIRCPAANKSNLYCAADIARVRLRSEARLGHDVTAAHAMQMGPPIFETSITALTSQGPCYRGRSAVMLAQAGKTFECVAEWLWSGREFENDLRWALSDVPRAIRDRLALDRDRGEQLGWHFSLLLLGTGSRRRRAMAGSSPDANCAARSIIQSMVGCMGIRGPNRSFDAMRPGESIASALLRVLGVTNDENRERILQMMLVVLADHELTGPTLAARVAASAGAHLHACISTALAANSGVALSRSYEEIENFLRSEPTVAGLLDKTARLQKKGAIPPGFNHPAYVRNDPRADFLIELAGRYKHVPTKPTRILEYLMLCRARMQLYPRVDIAVVLLAMILQLPQRSASGLYMVARTAGWVAHVQEQGKARFMLRPRAKYVPDPKG